MNLEFRKFRGHRIPGTPNLESRGHHTELLSEFRGGIHWAPWRALPGQSPRFFRTTSPSGGIGGRQRSSVPKTIRHTVP
jgi:hypothetical protein